MTTTVTCEDLAPLVTGWLPRRRWCTAAAGAAPRVRLLQTIVLQTGPAGDVLLCLAGVEGADGEVTYQVPVVVRPPAPAVVPPARPRPLGAAASVVTAPVVTAPGAADDVRPDGAQSDTEEPDEVTESAAVEEVGEPGLIGVLADGRRVIDGPYDALFTGWFARSLAARSSAGPVSWHLDDDVPVDPDAPVTVLGGEQSNTSLIIDAGGERPLIAKLFRVVQPGSNPDVEIARALSQAGRPEVPALVGWVEGLGEHLVGHLAAVSEYLPGSVDAWRLACEAVRAGEDFTATARAIGEATARVHVGLREACGTEDAGLAPVLDALRARLQWACAQVPALQERAVAAQAVIDAVGDGGARWQRIHGDLHLGQVLDAGVRGWVLLDFEGEPLRPLAERNRPDLAWRDLAGMLRSFDYAAGHVALGLPDDAPARIAGRAWSGACRAAFLEGYRAAAAEDDDLQGPQDEGLSARLLRALELDKALYEAVYEAGHRPGWLEIPLRAVTRLTSA